MPRPLLVLLATLYAAATILYSGIWLYYIRHPSKADIGIQYAYSSAAKSLEIVRAIDGGSAQRAGLRHQDRILAINGVKLDRLTPYYDSVVRGRPGDLVTLTVIRSDANLPETVPVVLDPSRPPDWFSRLSPIGTVALQVLGFYPLGFMVVGLAVLFFRPDDRNAWLLLLLFGAFIASAWFPEGAIHPALRGFAMSYRNFLGVLGAALFYHFFAVFPAPSLLDRRAPWLKYAFLAYGGILLPFVLWAIAATGSSEILWLTRGRTGRFNEKLSTVLLQAFYGVYALGGAGLGIVSLVLNTVRPATAEARRKARVIVWGVLGALLPSLLLTLVSVATGKGPNDIPFWFWAISALAMLLLPLSFGYAVVKHRVMEIPALLKRSARCALIQRGFVLLILVLSTGATLLFAFALSDLFRSGAHFSVPAGVGFGVVLAMAGSRVHRRVSRRIDRAFFRSAYDARQILQDLAEKARTATSRQELAALLRRHMEEALHPI